MLTETQKAQGLSVAASLMGMTHIQILGENLPCQGTLYVAPGTGLAFFSMHDIYKRKQCLWIQNNAAPWQIFRRKPVKRQARQNIERVHAILRHALTYPVTERHT